MCGIAAYIGPLEAASVLLVALERLKYRGYDSAGLALLNGGRDLILRKSAGRLKQLQDLVDSQTISGSCGIAHTRWATHGAPTTENAHPHTDTDRELAVAHNGIIENHEQLRKRLEADGIFCTTQTDTEVIPHLIRQHYQGDPIAAVQAVLPLLEGSYAFAVLFADHPKRIIAVRKGSPLLLGRGEDCLMLASDIPALLPHAQEVCQLDDGQLVDLNHEQLILYDQDQVIQPGFLPIEIDVEAVSMGDFDSFMAKEIAEQPEILARLLDSRLSQGRLVQPDYGVDLKQINHVVFLACGTSWHAALLGKRYLEHFARVHVEVDISSEYRYRNPVASGGTLVIPISQSGETADTLASLRLARSMFMPVIALVNVIDSTIARESDGVMPLLAGPEIGVASTKAYTAQVLALYLFALQMARARGLLSESVEAAAIVAAAKIPEQCAQTLQLVDEPVRASAELLHAAQATVFLGRGGEHPTAMEGALKLKEIAYVHAMGYAAGEFKHGPIALVTDMLPVVCIVPRDHMFEKMLSNLEEVRARSGRIIAIGEPDDEALEPLADHLFPVPASADPMLQPLLSILPLQLYALHVANLRGCDVDQPRNLAKSVTVE
jgi:glutamine---fructose-6-phosphate transaminase (isomerizing)